VPGRQRVLGLPQDKVHGIWVPGPGSYGRNDAGDAGIDAAVLSKRPELQPRRPAGGVAIEVATGLWRARRILRLCEQKAGLGNDRALARARLAVVPRPLWRRGCCGSVADCVAGGRPETYTVTRLGGVASPRQAPISSAQYFEHRQEGTRCPTIDVQSGSPRLIERWVGG
jgi:hypothetical protein